MLHCNRLNFSHFSQVGTAAFADHCFWIAFCILFYMLRHGRQGTTIISVPLLSVAIGAVLSKKGTTNNELK